MHSSWDINDFFKFGKMLMNSFEICHHHVLFFLLLDKNGFELSHLGRSWKLGDLMNKIINFWSIVWDLVRKFKGWNMGFIFHFVDLMESHGFWWFILRIALLCKCATKGLYVWIFRYWWFSLTKFIFWLKFYFFNKFFFVNFCFVNFFLVFPSFFLFFLFRWYSSAFGIWWISWSLELLWALISPFADEPVVVPPKLLIDLWYFERLTTIQHIIAWKFLSHRINHQIESSKNLGILL